MDSGCRPKDPSIPGRARSGSHRRGRRSGTLAGMGERPKAIRGRVEAVKGKGAKRIPGPAPADRTSQRADAAPGHLTRSIPAGRHSARVFGQEHFSGQT